jgi:hypothetical protein
MQDNLYLICRPRPDVLEQTVFATNFAADCSQVLRSGAEDEHRLHGLFFASPYPAKSPPSVLPRGALQFSSVEPRP